MSGAFVFVGGDIVLTDAEGGQTLPDRTEVARAFADLDRDLDTTRLPPGGEGRPEDLVTFVLPAGTPVPPGYRTEGLRVAFHTLDAEVFRRARRAKQLVDWVETHRFCSRCGDATHRDPAHLSMTCASCHQRHYPRVSPAVIVLVQRGNEALLGRSPHFPPGVYSTLAGFVEPGESIEECVHREIAEEVGVKVTNLRYWDSQPHPFPHSLMIGFVAEWASGSIDIDPTEIEDARWFHRDDLPVLPHRMSIAYALIQDFVRRTATDR